MDWITHAVKKRKREKLPDIHLLQDENTNKSIKKLETSGFTVITDDDGIRQVYKNCPFAKKAEIEKAIDKINREGYLIIDMRSRGINRYTGYKKGKNGIYRKFVCFGNVMWEDVAENKSNRGEKIEREIKKTLNS